MQKLYLVVVMTCDLSLKKCRRHLIFPGFRTLFVSSVFPSLVMPLLPSYRSYIVPPWTRQALSNSWSLCCPSSSFMLFSTGPYAELAHIPHVVLQLYLSTKAFPDHHINDSISIRILFWFFNYFFVFRNVLVAVSLQLLM